jgi:SAM-dependent methyltransferase/uncharacterized protein YbaR (Trm112 family)
METKSWHEPMAERLIDILRCPYCWGDFSFESFRGTPFDSDSYGTLTCDCATAPVINGIPILDRKRHNERRLVNLVRQGAFEMASSECLMVDIEAGRMNRFKWRLLRKLNKSNRLLQRIDSSQTFREALRVGIPVTNAWHQYLLCRFSDPTFVAGEWILRHAPAVSGWILDVPAGAGHYSLALRRRHPDAAIVAADISFFNLLMLKKYVVPSAASVCLDANVPLPFKDSRFDLVVSSDGWHYLNSQALFLNELVRTRTVGARVAILHTHNREAPNYTPGHPISLHGFRRILESIFPDPVVILDENAAVEQGWAGERGRSPFTLTAKSDSPVFDVWIGEIPTAAADVSDREATSGLGKWIVNPLYVMRGDGTYVRCFADRLYQDEFSRLEELLPERFYSVALDQHAPDPELVRGRALLFVPNRY